MTMIYTDKKAEKKRYSTTMIVTYRKSNSTKVMYFDEFEDAKDLVEAERELHPRSKKFNPFVFDNLENKYIRI